MLELFKKLLETAHRLGGPLGVVLVILTLFGAAVPVTTTKCTSPGFTGTGPIIYYCTDRFGSFTTANVQIQVSFDHAVIGALIGFTIGYIVLSIVVAGIEWYQRSQQ